MKQVWSGSLNFSGFYEGSMKGTFGVIIPDE